MQSLPLFLRLTGRPVILLGSGPSADAKRRLLDRAGAKVIGEEGQAALAIVAIEDEDEAHAAVSQLKARGILVNAVDRPALCDFTLPAIIDRDPVLIAIGTGGASAGLAKSIRQRFEASLPASLGTLAQALHSAREAIKARWPNPEDRRKAIDSALDPGGPLDFERAFVPAALSQWLSEPDARPRFGLRLMTITSDDPDQLTLEQARLLGQADTVIYAPSISSAIVNRARADAARICQDSVPTPLPPGLTIHLVKG